MVGFDYEQEFMKMKLAETREKLFFKPELGQHKIKILSEPVQASFYKKGDQEVPQIKMPISVNGKEYIWTVTAATTIKSLYGQLVILGKHEGHLAGEEITLLVMQSKGKDGKDMKQYTILESVNIMPKYIFKEETVK